MLGNLLKYDMKFAFRKFLPVLLILIVLTALSPIVIKINVQFAVVLLFVSYMIVFFASMLLYIVFYYQFFKNNLYGPNGYLMFTLPVKSKSILMSKLITTILLMIIILVTFFLTAFISMWIYMYIVEGNPMMGLEIRGTTIFYILKTLILISIYMIVILVFLSMVSLGATVISCMPVFNKKYSILIESIVNIFSISFIIYVIYKISKLFPYYFMSYETNVKGKVFLSMPNTSNMIGGSPQGVAFSIPWLLLLVIFTVAIFHGVAYVMDRYKSI